MDERNNRLAEALQLRGLKQVELAERTGLTAPQINSWIKQKWQPKSVSLHKMAKVLDVSELWLAGYDVPMERPQEQKKADQLSQLVKVLKSDNQTFNIMINLLKLDPEQITIVETMVNQFAQLKEFNSQQD